MLLLYCESIFIMEGLNFMKRFTINDIAKLANVSNKK